MTEGDKALVDRLASAIKKSIGKQFNATPIHPNPNIEDWTASGGVIDLKQVAQALLPIISDRIEALIAENKKLREWSLKAFTVVEWVSGEGKLLSYPYYDADDLLGDGVELLGVYSSDDARAALGETK